MSWIRGIPSLSDSLLIETQSVPCHFCDVVLLVVVLLLFVKVEQFLVQRLIAQLEILQTSIDMFVFPEPVLSSADVVQHILDFVVAKRLPSVVLEDSYVSRTLVVSSPYF